MTIKLIGADNAVGDGNNAPDYFVLGRFQAVASGNMTLFYLRCANAGNIKVALYADNSGEPGALITAMNTGQAITIGWVSVSFTSSAIVSGNYYWLGTNLDCYGMRQLNSGGTRRYKVATYSTFTFPNPAGSGFTSDSLCNVEAGWGITWTYISHVKGIAAASISHKKGVAVASISHVKGVAV
jgi:hypothetical protein